MLYMENMIPKVSNIGTNNNINQRNHHKNLFYNQLNNNSSKPAKVNKSLFENLLNKEINKSK